MDHLNEIARCGWVVISGVRNAKPAARAQLARLEAQLVAELKEQVEHDAHRVLVSAEPEDLRADVRVQTDQLEAGMLQRLLDRASGRAGLDGESEFRVKLPS